MHTLTVAARWPTADDIPRFTSESSSSRGPVQRNMDLRRCVCTIVVALHVVALSDRMTTATKEISAVEANVLQGKTSDPADTSLARNLVGFDPSLEERGKGGGGGGRARVSGFARGQGGSDYLAKKIVDFAWWLKGAFRIDK